MLISQKRRDVFSTLAAAGSCIGSLADAELRLAAVLSGDQCAAERFRRQRQLK